ncbi:DMT family transporter [Balneatrix alpica]|uniref:DMT family transporter n=1 Tax=Balneatrix alpica TaxID=75684 RepID=A0ABV5ZB04_9GAMM|nr:DMT family transporter [Balneatrix alpica]
MSEQSGKADALLILVTVIAACGWIFSKEALQGLPPLLFIGVRFILAGMVIAVVAGARFRQLDVSQWRHAGLASLLMGVAMICWILGLFYGQYLAEGAFLTSLGAILVPLLARLLFKDPLPLSLWLALPFAIAGLAALSLRDGLRLELGSIFFLSSALLFALHFNLMSRSSGRIHALPLTAIQLLGVGLTSLLVSSLTESWPEQVEWNVLGWLLASAFIATSLRFFLQVYAQGLTSASSAALWMTLEPVWTTLLAALWFAEVLSPQQYLGCGLIFASVLISKGRNLRQGWQRFTR